MQHDNTAKENKKNFLANYLVFAVLITPGFIFRHLGIAVAFALSAGYEAHCKSIVTF